MPAYDRRPLRQRENPDPLARYLGEVQAEVMDVFWRRGSATVRDVVDELSARRPHAYTTVLTLISRLWARGLLTREPEGRGFRYQAACTREQLLDELSGELIERLFSDFGEIGVARLAERLEELGSGRRKRLWRAAGAG